MAEKIMPGLYRVEIPLPKNPLKFLNSYILKGPDRTLVVDTGLNRDECYRAMRAGLEELEVDLEKTWFFITHLHADHFGLVGRLVTDAKHVYFSRPETEIIESWTGWEPMVRYAAQNGFPEDQLRAALNSHPGFKYGAGWIPDMNVLEDGDAIDIGDFHFTCVHTPGHTRGHVCLYEPEKKFLIAGDHVLGDITPNIQCWSDREDPLRDYLASLDKVGALEVGLALPGHRSLVRDLGARIGELKEHHQKRLAEVLEIVGRRPGHAFGVASEMTWDINYDSWDDFPLAQKWFATAEATAHLRRLEEAGEISRESTSGVTLYVK